MQIISIGNSVIGNRCVGSTYGQNCIIPVPSRVVSAISSGSTFTRPQFPLFQSLILTDHQTLEPSCTSYESVINEEGYLQNVHDTHPTSLAPFMSLVSEEGHYALHYRSTCKVFFTLSIDNGRKGKK